MTDPRIPDATPETSWQLMIESARYTAARAHFDQWYSPGVAYMVHTELTGTLAWQLAGDPMTPDECSFLLKAFAITLPTGKKNVRSWTQLIRGSLADLEAVQRVKQALYQAIGILHDGPEDADVSLELDVTFMVCDAKLPWFVAHAVALLTQRAGQSQDDYMRQLQATEVDVRSGLSKRDRDLEAKFDAYLKRSRVPMDEYLQQLALAAISVKLADLWFNNSADVKTLVWLPEITAEAAKILPGADRFKYFHPSELDPNEFLEAHLRRLGMLPADPWPPEIAEAIRTADRRLEEMRAARVMKYQLEMPRLLEVAASRFGEDSATCQRIAALIKDLAATELDQWVPPIAKVIRNEVRERGLNT